MAVLDYLEETFLAIALLVVVVVNFANILARYVLDASIAPSEEVMVYLFAWATFIGIATAVKRKGHLGLSVLTDLLPKKGQRVVAVIGALLMVGFFVILFRLGVDLMLQERRSGQTSPALGMPEWFLGAAIPVASVLIIFRTIQVIYRELAGGGAK